LNSDLLIGRSTRKLWNIMATYSCVIAVDPQVNAFCLGLGDRPEHCDFERLEEAALSCAIGTIYQCDVSAEIEYLSPHESSEWPYG
jgi:hypothetical protein